MYYNFNDYELLYLFKEGEEAAFKELANKYTHYLAKLFRDGRDYNIPRNDYIQEGLIVLGKAAKSFKMDGNISFFTFYSICLSRYLLKVSKKYYFFRETKEYNQDFIVNKDNHYFDFVINKLLNDEDEYMATILLYCVRYNCSVKYYCSKFNLQYEKIYYEYKKFLKNLRKKVD